MKTKKPNLTKDQRKRLFLLARLLDRVPKKRFDMSTWINLESCMATPQEAKRLKNECGTVGCACGWGMTSPAIRGTCQDADALRNELLDGTNHHLALFGGDREASPKEVAADIRSYLKDGTLPKC